MRGKLMNECEWLSMDAKIVQHDCISCNERMEIDFNVDDYSSEITIVNGKKTEKRRFMKRCEQCGQMNTYVSDQKVDWGSRRGVNVRKIFIASTFSCLAMVIGFVAIAYFAGKGLMTVFDWLF
jgi:hypothetical protein